MISVMMRTFLHKCRVTWMTVSSLIRILRGGVLNGHGGLLYRGILPHVSFLQLFHSPSFGLSCNLSCCSSIGPPCGPSVGPSCSLSVGPSCPWLSSSDLGFYWSWLLPPSSLSCSSAGSVTAILRAPRMIVASFLCWYFFPWSSPFPPGPRATSQLLTWPSSSTFTPIILHRR